MQWLPVHHIPRGAEICARDAMKVEASPGPEADAQPGAMAPSPKVGYFGRKDAGNYPTLQSLSCSGLPLIYY